MKWLSKYKNDKDFLELQKTDKKNRINSKDRKKRKTYDFLVYYFLLLIALIPLVLNSSIKTKDINYCLGKSYSNEITIKIQGTGEQKILNASYYLCPDYVYLNGDTTNVVGTDCHFVNIPTENENINTLKLIWNNIATSLYDIFDGITNLLYADFSRYDTSSVNDMHQMFLDCHSLTSVDLTNLKTSLVTSMRLMFGNCISLKELDVSSFDTSNVIDMHFMFSNTKLIKSLDVSNFNTSKVINMEGMFSYMQSLEHLDVTNFDTSKVTTMNGMFYLCLLLDSLDLSNFDTSSVTIMTWMFYGCINLVSLDVSNFNTLQVTSMDNMFLECRSLNNLDLSSFYTPNLKSMYEMFFNCWSLNNLYIPNLDTSQITNMYGLFYNCYTLKSLNVSSLDTSNAIIMDYMFAHCTSLTSLNLSNFNTQNVKSMYAMIHNCQQLASVDVSSFDVSSVEDLTHMFSYCLSLNSLDLSNFTPSNAKMMSNMFNNCQKLNYLDLSNFDTSSVEIMDTMFANCYSLASLDLSSFNTENVKTFKYMFYDCNELKEIKLSNFNTNSLEDLSYMFFGNEKLEYIDLENYNEYKELLINQLLDYLPDNIVVCVKEDKNIIKFLNELYTKRCPTIYCGEDWKSKQKKYVYGNNNSCADDCNEFKYENNNTCYSFCPEGVDFCIPEVENAETTNNLDIVAETSINVYSPSTHINDVKMSSIIESGLKESDKITEIIETSNIIQEEFDITSHIISDTQRDITNRVSYQILVQTSGYNILSTNILEDNIESDSDNNNNIFYNISGKNNEEIYQEIISNILEEYTCSDGEDKIIKGNDNYIYQFTTPENEKDYLNGKKNNSNRVSKIDLGYCENILKSHYHIEPNISLIIVKFEKITNISSERSLQYEVYEPFNKTKLNLSLCDNTTISIYVPVVLSDELQQIYNQLKDMGYDLFDINGAFYQDICVPFKSPHGTDVLLSDRIAYYFHNNETVCQANCKVSDYSMDSQYLKCDCDTSNSEINVKKIDKLTTKTIYESFYDTLKFSNYKVLFCYKLPFRINSVTTNKGSILAIIYFVIYFIFLIIYCLKGTNQFKIYLAKEIINNPMKINDDISLVVNDKEFKKKRTAKIPETKIINKSKTASHIHPRRTTSRKAINKNNNIYNFPPKKNTNSLKRSSIKRKYVTQKTRNPSQKLSDNNLLITNKIFTKKSSEMTNITKTAGKLSFEDEKQDNIPQKKLDNFELNNLEYEEALKLDKRSFIQIYWSILRREHLILFTFFIRNDYNLVHIKFARFIFLVCTDMALNVFFFSDETMHQMHLDYGKYNFLLQIPQIVYSTLVSQLIEIFLCYLSLTDKHFYEIKNIAQNSRQKVFKIIKCVKIKIVTFFVFTLLMFAFYWYAVACFCSVYENTQSAFIKDSISSFVLGLLYPFILYLFPAVLRLIALRANKTKLGFIYATSDIIPFF